MLRVDDYQTSRQLTLDLVPVEEPMTRLHHRPPVKPLGSELALRQGSISAYSSAGSRSRNLDRFDVRLNGQDILVAAFDGHGTGRVVEYVWENLLQKVIESKWYAKDLQKALKEAFQTIQQEIIGSSSFDGVDGCVVVIAVLRDGVVTISNVGDCRAIKIHSEEGQAACFQQLSTDHSPHNAVEEQLVRQRGGLILRVHKSLRVNGEINVTRSLGDSRLKGILSSEPQIQSYRLAEHDRMLLLATDGLWSVQYATIQVTSNNRVAELAHHCLNQPNCAKALTNRLGVRLQDNIAVVAVRL